MLKKTQRIIKMPVFRQLFKLAIPIIMANLFQALYQMTDSFWVGRLGATALASVSICTPIVFLTISIGIGFSIAGSTFVAQYFGAKNHQMVGRAAAQTILMIVFVSIILTILGFNLAPSVLHLIGANQDIFNPALSFLRISFLALISNFCFFIFQSVMRGIGRPNIPVYIVITTVLLNFIFDPFLIFGFGPIPAFGPAGAALATLITQTIAAIIGFIILFKGKHGIHLKITDFKPDFSFIRKAFKIGLPSSIEQSSRNLVMVFMTSLIAGFGTTAVASYGAGSNIIQVAILVSIGLSIANGTLVGQNIGAGKINEAVKTSKLSAVIAFCTLFLLGIIVFIFSRQLISFFIPHDYTVINQASNFVRIVSFGFCLVGLQMSFGSVFNAAGLTHINMFLTILTQWLIQIPLAYFLSQKTSLGLYGVWLAMPITNLISSIISFTLYQRGSWKHKKIIGDEKIVIDVNEETIVEEGIH
jgi:putative MATE family efflux protein